MNTKFLHITSNLGSLFELQAIEDRWYDELVKVVLLHSPDVLAIHCQEMGGKDFDAAMLKVNKFIQTLTRLQCFSEYNRVRMFVDTGHTDINTFTALGSFYFISKRVHSVSLWNFFTGRFEEVTDELIFTETPGLFKLLSSDQFHFKDRFPNDYFPGVRWSRKGFLHTRWRINNFVVNLVNIHLFHDEDNLVALEQSPSSYCQYRKRALQHTLEYLSKNTLKSESVFIFGDFNFRLDLSSVVQRLTSQFHHPQFIRGEDGNLQKVFYRSSLSSDSDDSLCIERRKFFLNSHTELFKKRYEELVQYDLEPKSFQSLHELEVTFPPSYPFSEEIDKGFDYMEKRCPAWCDRILMNKAAMNTVEQSKRAPMYGMLSKDLCVGDHKPIFLFYSTNTSIIGNPGDLQQTEDQ